jgi:hypothetical protein
MIKHRLARLVFALAAVAGLAGGLAVAAPAAQARSCLSIHIQLSFGTQATGFDPGNQAGALIVNVAKPGRAYSYCTTTTYRGDPVGTIQTTTGLYVATNNNCDGLLLKTNAAQTGTAFANHITDTKHVIVSRPCDQAAGNRDGKYAVMASHNNSGGRWFICNAAITEACDTQGDYHAIDF